MIQLIAFLLLSLSGLGALAAVLFLTLSLFLTRGARTKIRNRLKRAVLVLLTAVALNAGLILYSQQAAFTPPILDERGKIPENSIAQLTALDLNGRRQWISLRGWDENLPVLLFLAGGPGGSQMAASRYELAELEKHFVVVSWDQPGAGKSYRAEKTKNMAVDTYIEDGLALTDYLKERFSQEKIFLVGESWGSALGVFLAEKDPASYHGLIGTAQMVAFLETELLDYEKALEIAGEKNDAGLIRKLEKNGSPPYYGKGVTMKSAVYLNYLSAQMTKNPQIHNPGYNTIRDLTASEYGLLDKINYVRGILNTYNAVYPQLYETDLRRDFSRLEIPVWFFLGRHDLNAPPALAEDYFEALQAPHKAIVWFEHSGHSPWINEQAKFIKEVLSCFTPIAGD